MASIIRKMTIGLLAQMICTVSFADYLQYGLNAYSEREYELAMTNFKKAVDNGHPEALIPLAYIHISGLPDVPESKVLAAEYIIESYQHHSFNPIVFASYFYQRTRTAEAAYLVGMTYFVSKQGRAQMIGSEPAHSFWYKKAVQAGMENPENYAEFLEVKSDAS